MHSTEQGFQPLDPGRVNTMDPVEMAYWCRQLGCDLAQLRAAIQSVGEHVTEIRTALDRASSARH